MATWTSDQLRRESAYSLMYYLRVTSQQVERDRERLQRSMADAQVISAEVKRRMQTLGLTRLQYDRTLVEITQAGDLVVGDPASYSELDEARDRDDPADLVDLTSGRPAVAEAVTAVAEERGAA